MIFKSKELKIQQRKAEFQLQAKIAEAEAERQVTGAAEAKESCDLFQHWDELTPNKSRFKPAKSSSTSLERNSLHPQSSELPAHKLIKSSCKSSKGNPEYPSNRETPEIRSLFSPTRQEESFQQLTEAQDRQHHALQQPLEQQQGMVAPTLP